MDLQAVRGTVETIARQAGAVLMSGYDQPHQEQTKKTPTDIVTEADTAAEAVIIPALNAAFPDHHIISEEGGGAGIGAPAETAEYFWHIDPLDGTSNYASGIPFFATSIGLAGRDMRPLVGVIYDPFSDELYSAARGFGATLNGRPLHVSDTDHLINAMLCSGFPYDAYKNPDNNLKEWAAFTTQVRALRRFGSIALELSYVASGRLDGIWEQRVNSWDVMAGIVIAGEAGAVVSDYAGEESQRLYTGAQIVASNAHLHGLILDVLRQARA